MAARCVAVRLSGCRCLGAPSDRDISASRARAYSRVAGVAAGWHSGRVPAGGCASLPAAVIIVTTPALSRRVAAPCPSTRPVAPIQCAGALRR